MLKHFKIPPLLVVLVLLSIILLGCGGFLRENHTQERNHIEGPSDFDSSLPSGILSFEACPIPLDTISYIMPLGHMMPPGHTFPTDHIYLVHGLAKNPSALSIEVYAPASGKVLDVYQFNQQENYNGINYDHRIKIGVSNSFTYYLIHLVLDPGISVGSWVNKGQRLGVLSPFSACLDLGVLNKDITLSFVNQNRYGSSTLHCDAPLKYFVEPYRNQLYAKVQRSGDDKDGKICYDQAGKLIGNWFWDGIPSNESPADKALVFAPTEYDPNKMVVSIGGVITQEVSVGIYTFDPTDPDPSTVTVSSGKVTYHLYPASDGQRVGLLIVQMLEDNKIKVEVFSDINSPTREFTSNAKIYIR